MPGLPILFTRGGGRKDVAQVPDPTICGTGQAQRQKGKYMRKSGGKEVIHPNKRGGEGRRKG